MDIQQKMTQLDWAAITESMNATGYASIPGILPVAICDELIANYQSPDIYRKTIVMEHHGYGQGQYKYFNYPLPPAVQQLREAMYPNIAPIANSWMQVLGVDTHFPEEFAELN
ncbi:MAG: prolyl 4-hydroxylase subunit alpha, partial [Cytophagaceae bacterium]